MFTSNLLEKDINIVCGGVCFLLLIQCQFWCEEASATVARVEKYSAECKTREAVEILYKQFNKFIEPIVPQQEERIQQILNLAKDLYGKDLYFKNTIHLFGKYKFKDSFLSKSKKEINNNLW